MLFLLSLKNRVGSLLYLLEQTKQGIMDFTMYCLCDGSLVKVWFSFPEQQLLILLCLQITARVCLGLVSHKIRGVSRISHRGMEFM